MKRHRRRLPAIGVPAGHGGRVVSASEAAKNFGALVERVREARATYVVERSGVPVVEINPVVRTRTTVADLVRSLRAPERLDESYLAEVERGIALLNEPTVPAGRWES